MSDGTTAVQVSPIPTEQDMNIFRRIMDNALNAIVQASELAKVVESLKAEVSGFKQDLEILRSRNKDLDEMLAYVRAQRDEAEQKLSESQRNASELGRLVHEQLNNMDSQDQEIERLKRELQATKEDAASAHESADRAQSRAQEAEAKLKDIEEFAKRLFPATPTAETQGQPLTQPQAEQAKPSRVYDGDPGFTWDKPTIWDNDANKYYNEAA